MKILVVDDSKFNLAAAEKVLSESGLLCKPILCNSGLKALEIIKAESIDIVLLDIVMPKFSGIDVLKELRKEPLFDGIQVIMFTSLHEKEVLQESFKHGANDFVTKPIEPIEFISRIKAAIRARNLDLRMHKLLQTLETKNNQLTLLAEKLKESQFHLINKEKLAAIGELAAGIAHEINNPLGYFSSNLQTLEKYTANLILTLKKYKELVISLQRQSSLEIQDLLQEILQLENALHIDFIINDIEYLIGDSKEGIERVTKIVQSLRRFARTDFAEKFTSHNINEIIAETLLILKHEAKNIAVIGEEYGHVPPVPCYRSQIGQVIMNIIINAIDAIKGQKRLEKGNIKVRTYSEANSVILEICDDGPGIDPGIKNRIFDPFFTTRDVGEGTGLGLSISHDIIVKKHNGEISLKNKDGRGTIFNIKLPIINEAMVVPD